MTVTLKDLFVVKEGTTPTFGSRQSAAFDIYSNETTRIAPMSVGVVSTGLYLNSENSLFRDNVCFVKVYSRSGMAARGVFVANAPGIIDSDYTGEIKVILYNSTTEEYRVRSGDRVAQGVIEVINEYQRTLIGSSNAEARTGGFGSTGT